MSCRYRRNWKVSACRIRLSAFDISRLAFVGFNLQQRGLSGCVLSSPYRCCHQVLLTLFQEMCRSCLIYVVAFSMNWTKTDQRVGVLRSKYADLVHTVTSSRVPMGAVVGPGYSTLANVPSLTRRLARQMFHGGIRFGVG